MHWLVIILFALSLICFIKGAHIEKIGLENPVMKTKGTRLKKIAYFLAIVDAILVIILYLIL